ncbi:hypothetical protein KBB92_00300 [Candidatus Shapirobacteria bacterium]|nr:hypothetical protein [Candidatus Shapirobacteria bacterium]
MTERTNLVEKNNQSKYLILAVILLILTAGGIFFLISRKNAVMVNEEKQKPQIIIPTLSRPSPTPIINETIIIPTGTMIASEAAKPTLNNELSYANPEYNFFVTYNNKRKLYPEKETSGERFNFYSNEGSITVHAGEKWSWEYPLRDFTNTILVDGVNSFVYEIEKQKLVDFENGKFKYTIQCIHNAKKELIEECNKFVTNFKFL